MRLAASADDYGLAPGVSGRIRTLLHQGRLTGTTAMTVFPDWSDEGAALAEVPVDRELGVHLVLTDHPGLHRTAPWPPFSTLARQAWAGRIDLGAVRGEIEAQLDAFERAVGRAPDVIDGHHHAHQLPGIRDAVVDAARRRLAPGGWVRTTADAPGRILARGVATGRALAFAAAGRGLAARLDRAHVRRNQGFIGAYGFDGGTPYDARVRRWLRRMVDGTVLMVHPGDPDAVLARRDALGAPRRREADYLAGPDWPDAVEASGAVLAPLRAPGANTHTRITT